MKQIAALAALLAPVVVPSAAHACSDAGAARLSCADGGYAAGCAVHDDCGSGQLCGERLACVCATECEHDEECSEAGCRCVGERPAVPTGCTLVTDTCGSWAIECPPMDAGPPPGPRCNTDGATPRACTTDDDCVGAPGGTIDMELVCTDRGVCDCPPPRMDAGVGPGSSAGCSVVGVARARPAHGAALALVAVLLVGRRARGR